MNPVYRTIMKNTIFSRRVAGFGLAKVHTADAAEKITHEQIEEVMKKGFKAKLHNDLAANKEVLAKYAQWLAAYKPEKGDAASWKAKTGAIVAAIKAGDQAGLNKAANCKTCQRAQVGYSQGYFHRVPLGTFFLPLLAPTIKSDIIS